MTEILGLVRSIITSIDFVFVIDSRNEFIKYKFNKFEKHICFKSNVGEKLLTYFESNDGDPDEISSSSDKLKYEFEIDISPQIWNTCEPIEKYNTRIRHLIIPINNRFGTYPALKTFIKYIHVYLYYNTIQKYNNNIISYIRSDFAGIEKIEIEFDKYAVCHTCECELFGKSLIRKRKNRKYCNDCV